MIVCEKMKSLIDQQEGWTRKMFEAGIEMKKRLGPENVYDFSLGNPDTEPPSSVRDRLVEVLRHPVPGMHRYMPNNGTEYAREGVAKYLTEEHGLPFSPNHVFMTVGCAGGLNIVMKTMLNPGDEVIVPTPFFWEFKNYIENFGGVMRLVETDDQFQLDIGAIESALNQNTRAILINSPNNPTGVVFDKERLGKLADLLYSWRKKGKEIYLFGDDAYRKIVYSDTKLPDLFNIYDLVISVTSHSKDLALPGERIGYIAISPNIQEAPLLVSGLMIAGRILGFVNAPALFQLVAGEFQNISVSIADYEAKRDALYGILIEAGFECVKPGGAFYLFPKCPIPDDVEFVTMLQQEERILAVPGRGFGKGDCFRLAYCVPMQSILNAREGFLRVGEKYNKAKVQ